MKKLFAYTLTAILLGAVIMLFPLRILFASYSQEGPITLTMAQTDEGSTTWTGELRTLSYLESLQGDSLSEESLQKLRETYGFDAVQSQPTDPFVGILGISFFVALVVYFLFRRRRPDSAYRHSQYLLHP
jgi:hypothetical protein